MPRLMIVLFGLMFALAEIHAAGAQVTLDVAKITCDQYSGYRITSGNIAIWLSGYYSGLHDGSRFLKLRSLWRMRQSSEITVSCILRCESWRLLRRCSERTSRCFANRMALMISLIIDR